jgi:nickel-dependent lactate racemase
VIREGEFLMIVELGYGKEKASVDIPDANVQAVLKPNKVNVDLTGAAEVSRAIQNPIGSKRLKDIVRQSEHVCIITSDITRPMPSKLVLPVVIDELNRGGIEDGDITVVFALGNHRAHTEDEKKYIAGEDIFSRVRCIMRIRPMSFTLVSPRLAHRSTCLRRWRKLIVSYALAISSTIISPDIPEAQRR